MPRYRGGLENRRRMVGSCNFYLSISNWRVKDLLMLKVFENWRMEVRKSFFIVIWKTSAATLFELRIEYKTWPKSLPMKS
tara:strand:- start:292 stop:531 length:240 start_codon:yes stop_codon:yes gene_type:complete